MTVKTREQNEKNRVVIFDTTLRDGEQCPGASMNFEEKLEMARQLLESSGNDLTWVAAQLGIHSTTLYRWRKTKKI